MNPTTSQYTAPARIEYLKVRNFRALREVEFKELTPLTVLLGPNGSGKSTVFDVFAFLSECFEVGLRRAWDQRGRAKELRTRGNIDPVVIELKYREQPGTPLITYHLAIDEDRNRPVVKEEWLQWRRGQRGRPFRFLDYREGQGRAVSGEQPGELDMRSQGTIQLDPRSEVPLQSPDLLAVNALGQFADHPRVAALRDFITGWHVSYLSADSARGQPEAGPQERLSKSGDNLANVIQHLAEQHPDRLNQIFEVLRQRVPRIERVLSDVMPDGRLLLQIKDAPFSNPVLARFASDGTLKILAYLAYRNLSKRVHISAIYGWKDISIWETRWSDTVNRLLLWRDAGAVCNAYPRVSKRIPNQARYRHPDAIRGGTWEAFERILKRHGYFKTGLRKVEAARDVGIHIDSNRSRSHSFVKFREAIIEATA